MQTTTNANGWLSADRLEAHQNCSFKIIHLSSSSSDEQSRALNTPEQLYTKSCWKAETNERQDNPKTLVEVKPSLHLSSNIVAELEPSPTAA